jgi:hypothetical protein
LIEEKSVKEEALLKYIKFRFSKKATKIDETPP